MLLALKNFEGTSGICPHNDEWQMAPMLKSINGLKINFHRRQNFLEMALFQI